MASRTKQRKAGKQQAPHVEEQALPITTTTTANNGTAPQTNTPKTGERLKMALTPDEIQALLGKTRQKGQYTEMLAEFLASGEGGTCANEEWVAIRDKKASTIKQGFVNAIEKAGAPEGADKVKVISNEDKVYLINLAAADVTVAQEAA